MANSSDQMEALCNALAARSREAASAVILLQLVLDDLAQVEADIAATRPSYRSEHGFLRHAGGLIVRRGRLMALIDDPDSDLLAYAREQLDIAQHNVDGLRPWYGSDSDLARQCGEELARLERCRDIVSKAEGC